MNQPDYSCNVSGNSADCSVYMTLNDGPNPYCTPDILDILAAARTRYVLRHRCIMPWITRAFPMYGCGRSRGW